MLSEVEGVLRSLRDVWDEDAVDELDHALQAAARATEDGADDELVLATALHDLGHSPLFGDDWKNHHDTMARSWLTPRFGERVGWLAGAHVAAKRYLVATDPEYAGTLSDVSVDSLHHQGGAGADPAFVDHPWWTDALRLRRYDDAAKVPGAAGLSIDGVLAVAERILLRADRK
ncbi:HD family phosphohydrolase [Mycobacterium neglectum]|uniref:HD family phosphohydrolase n=1 Tax=Mycobacterium neglectum TaxID=242737 RepID=UPI003CCBD6FE